MDILVRSWQDLGTILAKILSRSCHGLPFAMVTSYQDRHASKINLDKKPKMTRKICYELLNSEKKKDQKNFKFKAIENAKLTENYKIQDFFQPLEKHQKQLK